MAINFLFIILVIYTLSSFALGLVFGGRAERAGTLCILIANIAAEIAIVLQRPAYPSHTIFAIDLGLAVALLIIAIRYSSLWLGAAMLLQSVALYSHSIVMSGSELSQSVYVDLNTYLTLAMMLCILIATSLKIRARQVSRRALAIAKTPISSAALLNSRSIGRAWFRGARSPYDQGAS